MKTIRFWRSFLRPLKTGRFLNYYNPHEVPGKVTVMEEEVDWAEVYARARRRQTRNRWIIAVVSLIVLALAWHAWPVQAQNVLDCSLVHVTVENKTDKTLVSVGVIYFNDVEMGRVPDNDSKYIVPGGWASVSWAPNPDQSWHGQVHGYIALVDGTSIVDQAHIAGPLGCDPFEPEPTETAEPDPTETAQPVREEEIFLPLVNKTK